MTILAVNAGSSTLKFACYPIAGVHAQPALLTGCIDGLGNAGNLQLSWQTNEQTNGQIAQRTLTPSAAADRFQQALGALCDLLAHETNGRDIQAIAHRVVHGGEHYRAPVLVDESVLANLEKLCPLAPLHQPHNVAGIRAFQLAMPALPQIACFDTAFHASLPIEETHFALPPAFAEQGIRRYGFHGLSYQYVMQTLQQQTARATGRVVMAHLGSGSSLCAAQHGKSCATTMGFSALDGLMMGTRCGSLDAGVLLHLLEQGWNHAQLQTLLYRQSGLLGVSTFSADMRALRNSERPSARLAIDLYTHRVIRETGAMAACLGGLDILAFTGGIGEHDQQLRTDVCQQLRFLGVQLDQAKNNQLAHSTPNQAPALSLHAADSSVEIWMVTTDEGRIAAQAAATLLNLG